MAVTIKDVAAAANVSTATVSHVFNGTRFVTKETKESVWAAAARLGYIPSVSARSLRSNKSKRIGLLVPSIASFFSVDILDAVEEVLKEGGYQVVLGCSHEDLEREKFQIDSFNFQQIDGLIMFPAPGDHSYLDQMPRKYPIVFIDRMADHCERDAVLGDNEQSTYELVCQMIQDGHEKIGMINGTKGVSALQERMDGYKRALEEHGIPLEPAFIQDGNSTREGGHDAMERLIRDGRVTAVISLSHTMAVGCLSCLAKYQVKVPKEIAFVSYGESEWAEITNPSLTTMWHHIFEMGQMAAKKLLERLEECEKQENDRAPYEVIRLPMQLIRRETY